MIAITVSDLMTEKFNVFSMQEEVVALEENDLDNLKLQVRKPAIKPKPHNLLIKMQAVKGAVAIQS